MEWNLKNGTNLIELNKKELQSLVDTFSIRKIATVFDISQASARRIVYDKMEEYGITVTNGRINNFRPTHEPFSMEETDYGKSERNKVQIITKDGLLVFKGNSPIYKQKNQLSEVTKNYVIVMMRNREPLSFTNGTKLN